VSDTEPGEIMAREIAEQPAVLERILTAGLPHIREAAAAVKAANPRFALLTARGTSDNAAYYAKYLMEITLGMPVGLTSMSTATAYRAEPDLTDVLCVTVSQSGGSPILEILPLQQLAYHVTMSRGLNPDAPRALAKVTETH